MTVFVFHTAVFGHPLFPRVPRGHPLFHSVPKGGRANPIIAARNAAIMGFVVLCTIQVEPLLIITGSLSGAVNTNFKIPSTKLKLRNQNTNFQVHKVQSSKKTETPILPRSMTVLIFRIIRDASSAAVL